MTINAHDSNLLIILDEPFAGVTNDFVPYMIETLEAMKKNHNIILVTNDHVHALATAATNIIHVSSMDRSSVRVKKNCPSQGNSNDNVPEDEDKGVLMDRQDAIDVFSTGAEYKFQQTTGSIVGHLKEFLRFFWDVELVAQKSFFFSLALFTCGTYALYIVMYWNSQVESSALVLIANTILSFFCLNPFLLSLVDWRNAMVEEGEALVHSSIQMNRTLKTIVTMLLLLVLSLIMFGVANLVVEDDSLARTEIWVGLFTDLVFTLAPRICLSNFTSLDLHEVQLLGGLPFLGNLFFSTTYSPGGGLEGLTQLRYLFPRFYLWCIVPGVEAVMIGCPNDDSPIMLYMCLASLVGVVLFLLVMAVSRLATRKLRLVCLS